MQSASQITNNSAQEINSGQLQLGIPTGSLQIKETIIFDIQRHLRKTLGLILTFTGIFFILFIVGEIQIRNGIPAPTNPINYIISYVNFLQNIMYFNAITIGSSMLVVDFEKRTGHLLFPKISRGRIFAARYITANILNTLVLLSYYLLIGFVTFVKYNTIPIELWISFGWAIYFSMGVIGFTFLISAMMRSNAGTLITTIVLLVLVLGIIEQLLMMVGISVEPIFILTYHIKIILGCMLDIPVRYSITVAELGQNKTLTFYQWLTPSPLGAFIGIGIYVVILTLGAFLIYRKRQLA
jgi:ABC-type transport system involved in multi-copper enzyme maturation permease subunit